MVTAKVQLLVAASVALAAFQTFSTAAAQSPVAPLVPYAWRNIDFAYPSDAERQNAVQSGTYIPQNVVLNDIDMWPDAVRGLSTGGFRVFVSTPRVTTGIPATLSTVSSVRNGDSFLLNPFPNWQAQNYGTNCNGFVTVDKMHIDRCGMLWALDTGRINEFVSPQRVCQPKLLIFDLRNNDNLSLRYDFPTGVVNDRSSLTTTVIDSRNNNCLDSIAYISDLNANGLVVFDLSRRTSWRVDHNYFYPYPRYGTYTISGVTFDLMDGVFGMALGPIQNNGDRTLYFHSLASVRQSWVSAAALRNTDLLAQRDRLRASFFVSEEFRVGQCSLEVITDDGIMIYNDLSQNALYCWNTATPATRANTQLIYQDNENFQFISGMKLKGDQLWIASNRVQNIMGNVTDTNFRFRVVYFRSVRQLLDAQGRRCLSGRNNQIPVTSTGNGGGRGKPYPPTVRPPLHGGY